jgi:hypothetical protein
MNYTNWSTRERQQPDGSGPAMHMWGADHRWDDTPETNKKAYIIEY